MKLRNRPFELGDTVTWTSTSAGVTKTKTGSIVALVPKGKDPAYVASGHLSKEDKINPWRGEPRDHVSYLVRVDRAKYLYWPRVSQLRQVEGDEG